MLSPCLRVRSLVTLPTVPTALPATTCCHYVIVVLLVVLSCDLSALVSAQSYKPIRALPGLPSNGIRQGPIAIGVLPDWSHEGPTDINRALGAGVSIIGDYINFSPSNYDMRQVEYHLPEVRRIVRGNVKAVYAPAFLYGASLNTWTPAMTQQIAATVKEVNQQGIVVYLRLLFEMNGGWMAYGLQPDLYRQIWVDVTNAVRAATNETYMLWAPNVWSGSVSDSSQGYMPYFPGEAYVDIAGLSYYSLGYQKSVNQAPATNMFRDGFQSFYDLMTPVNGSTGSKNPLKLSGPIPIVIAETSSPFHYELANSDPYYDQAGQSRARMGCDTDIDGPLPNLTRYTPSVKSPPFPRSDDELYLKATWFVQMTSNTTAIRFPNLQAVSLFNYLKRGGEGTEVLVDFRAIGGNQTVEDWFRNVIGNQTAYEIGYTGAAGRVSSGIFGAVGIWMPIALAVALGRDIL
ncbi:BQ5605_C015g07948 [Microbotryum silenes-dioicae]|uniref:BQ5605_C015g07948 protein n=1 Tax=Microbotryum silenes-dioicae TaxID=796604 RepID=A0A2X0LX94_9BASI|nr:BQ5605_C015g07948 [Microbotryum silenes-dioicae]